MFLGFDWFQPMHRNAKCTRTLHQSTKVDVANHHQWVQAAAIKI